jgi:hypothetical protein
MRRPITTIIKIALAAAVLTLAPAAALASSGQQTIRYHGVTLHVPRGWRVYNLARYPRTCVRFNRPAVYLGTPGVQQDCPPNEIGRPEAILLEPRGEHHVVIVRSADPQLNRLTAATSARRRADEFAEQAHAEESISTYVGKGFDACRTPTTKTLSGFTGGEYRAVGMYIGGANLACAQPNVNPALVVWAANNGWHLIPTYVGLQAPKSSCGACEQIPENTAQDIKDGQVAAEQAVSEMQSLGLGTGNPIYYDMEAYDQGGARTKATLTFLQAWTEQLHADHYLSGVYGSGDSTIHDLVNTYGPRYLEPDELWVATWDNDPTDFEYIPSGDWAETQRLNQFAGDESLHGMDVDYDYIDGATAPDDGSTLPPTTSPLLSVASTAAGLIDAVAGWNPASSTDQIFNWELLGGNHPSTLAPIVETTFGLEKTLISTDNAFPYYEIKALGSSNNTLGVSPITPAPAHIAIYGARAFVPAQGDARLPVGCFWPTACNLRLTLRAAGQTIATSTIQQVASYQGGTLKFHLNASGQRLLAKHRAGLNASATVTDLAGKRVEAPIKLTAYDSSVVASQFDSEPSPTLRLFGRTAFVVGRTGGVLAACSGLATCEVETTITGVFASTLAQTGVETIGANQLGYLYFTLTKAAHKLLDSTPGNDLQVAVRMVNQVPELSDGFGQPGLAQGNITLTQAY